MTLPSKVNEVFETGNGTARTFSFSPVVIFADSELEVITRVTTTGVETVRTLGTGATNYSINIAAGSYPSTGSILFPAAGGTLLPSTETIHIRRVVTKTQDTRLARTPYDPAVQEKQFDKFAATLQEVLGILDRCLKAQASFPSTIDMELPPLITGNLYPRFSSDKTEWEMVALTATGTASPSDTVGTAVDLDAAAAGTSGDFARVDHVHLVDEYVLIAADVHNKLNFI